MDKGADDSHTPSPDVPIPLVRASYRLAIRLQLFNFEFSGLFGKLLRSPPFAGLVFQRTDYEPDLLIRISVLHRWRGTW